MKYDHAQTKNRFYCILTNFLMYFNFSLDFFQKILNFVALTREIVKDKNDVSIFVLDDPNNFFRQTFWLESKSVCVRSSYDKPNISQWK